MPSSSNDHSIGRLTLDISDVQQKVNEVNAFLSKIGANVNLEKKLSEGIKNALNKLVTDAKTAGEEAQKAFAGIGKGGGDNLGSLESKMEKVTSSFQTFSREADQSGKTVEKLVSTVVSGMDSAGNKIKEFVNAEGDISKRTVETADAVQKALKIYQQLYEVEAKLTDLRSRGQINTAAFAKAINEAERLRDELAGVDRATQQAAKSTAEYARMAQQYDDILRATNAGRVERETADIERLTQRAEDADARRAESAERAANREAEATARATERQIQERQRLNLMYREMFDRIAENEANAALEQERVQMERIIALYQEYYKNKTNAVNAESKGNTASADMYTQISQEALARLQEYDRGLLQVAERTDAVRKAQTDWQNAITSSAVKDSAGDVDAYAKALADLYNAQAKFNDALTNQKVEEGTAQYEAMRSAIDQLRSDSVQAGSRIDEANRRAAESYKVVQDALRNLKASEARSDDYAELNKTLTYVRQKYTELTDAIKNYQAAKNLRNTTDMNESQAKITAIMQEISVIQQVVSSTETESAVKQQILNVIQQIVTAEHQNEAAIKGTVSGSNELQTSMTSIMTRLFSIMAVVNTLKSLISNTVEYVSEYSDKMNEIQMITLKTDVEVEKLAKTYREMAADMDVSSQDMADAAIYFTRQGLEAEEIEKRLRNVTMYAKAANVEFTESAEIITSIVNSMGLVEQEAEDGRNATQRVADVLLKVGDNAATSGEEIGQAMQKAAAAAGTFGVSFEHMVAYIATVSETTRQNAKTIGTALNTIIARLHSIRTTGYNKEDETQINDVAKALSRIDIELMDQYGEWRDMDVIFEEIAEKWDKLDGKTRSYIATSMAGVKQQNVFLALMNDMSKGVEQGSRYFELYDLAIDSAGTATEKYAVYQDSVAASQERLNVAQEKFYSILDDDIIKDWNNMWAGFINQITHGVEAFSGLNLIIPAIIAGVVGISVAIKGLNAGLGATVTLASLLKSHPIMVGIAAAAAALVVGVKLISEAVSIFETSAERYERFSNNLQTSQEKLSNFINLQKKTSDMFSELEEVDDATNVLKKYGKTLDELRTLSPRAKQAVDDFREGIIDQTEAARILNAELAKSIELQGQVSFNSLRGMMSNWKPTVQDVPETVLNWDIDYSNGGVNANADFLKKLKDYYYQWAEEKAGNIFSSIFGHSTEYITDALGNTISDMLADYMGSSLTEDQIWAEIGQTMWKNIFLGGGSTDIISMITEEATTMIDTVVSTIAQNFQLDSVQFGAFRKSLFDQIFGADGKLDIDEYKNLAKVITGVLDQISVYGVKINPEQTLNYIIDQVFGDDIPNAIKSGVSSIANNSDVVNQISEAYQQLIEAGFSNAEIKDVLGEKDVADWAKAVETAIDQTKTAITDKFGADAFTKNGENMLDQLDLSTLKMMKDMMEAGVTIEQFEDLFNESDSVEQFTAKLKLLKKELEFTPEDAGDQTTAGYIKTIQNTQKDIDALNTAIEHLKTNGKLDDGEFMNLLGAHSDLVNYTKSADTLRERLEKLAEEAKKTQKETIKAAMMNDESTFANSKYAQEGFATLKQYRDSLKEDSAEAKAFDEAMDEMAETTLKWLTGVDDAGESVVSLDDKVKAIVADMNLLDKAIDGLEKGEGIDFKDMFDLATLHPEILQVIDDEEKLLEVLRKYRRENEGKQKQVIIDAMYEDDHGFINTTQWANTGAKSLKEYVDKFGGSKEAVIAYLTEIADKSLHVGDIIKEAFDTSAIKTYESEISNIDKLMAQIAEDGTVKFSDILEMATAHPEIMSVVGDLGKLKDKLAEIKNLDRAAQRGSIIDMLLQDENFSKQSKWAGNLTEGDSKFSTLKDWMDKLPEGSEKINEVRNGVGALVDELLKYAEISSGKAFDISLVESYQKEIKGIDDILEKINETNRLDFDDILGLAETHPELLAYIGDLTKMKDALANIQTTDRGNMRQTMIDALMGSNAFMKAFTDSKGINYSSYADEYENLQKYVDAHQGAKDRITGDIGVMVDAFLALKNAEAKTFDISNVTKYEAEIQTLTGLIEGIERGDSIKFSDLMGIAESHPEILTAIKDLESFKKAIKDTSDEVREGQKAELAGVLMNSEKFIKSTKWGNEKDKNGNAFVSLQAYVDAHADAKDEVEQYINDLIKVMLEYEQIEQNAFNADEIKKYTDDIANLDNILQGITDHKQVTFGDILGVASSHPEIIALLGDLTSVEDGLKKIKEALKKEQRQTVIDDLMNNEKFFQNLNWDIITPEMKEKYKTLNEYIKGEGDELGNVQKKAEEAADALLNLPEAFAEAFSLDSVSDAQKEIDKLDKMIKQITENKKMDLDDVLGITEAHPELLNMIGSLDKFKEALEGFRAESRDKQIDEFVKAMMKNKDYSAMFLKGEMTQEGETIEDYIKRVPDEAEGVTSAIRVYVKALFDYIEQEEEETFNLDKVKKYESEIANFDKIIKGIDDGEEFSFSDILGIAETHPEILLFVDDADMLKTKLEELREEARKSQKESLVKTLLNDADFFKGSKWDKHETDAEGNPLYNSLQDYIDAHGGLEEIQAELEAIIEKGHQVGKVLKKAFDISDVKKLHDEIESIDEILETMNSGGTASFDDIFGIVSQHPAMMASIGNLDQFKEKLVELRGEIKETQKEKLVDALVGDTDYVQALVNSGRAKNAQAVDQILNAAKADADKLINWAQVITKAFDIEDVKKYQKEIETLGKTISSIEKDGTFDFSDVMGIAETHPEILLFINDIDGMKKKLQELRAEAVKNAKESMINSISNSTEFMAGSKFAQYGYATFTELIEHSNNEIKGQAVDYLNSIANGAIVLDEKLKDAFDASVLKNYNTEIGNVDKALKDLAEGKKIDVNTILSIAETHPEILQFLNDTDKMKESLEGIKATLKQNEQTSFKDMLLDSASFLKASQWSEAAKGYNTLRDYMKSLAEDESQELDSAITKQALAFMGLVDALNASEDATKSYKDQVKDATDEMAKLNGIIADLKENEATDLSDLLGIAEAHPELLAVIGDQEKMLALLREWNKEQAKNAATNIRNMINNSTEFFQNSPYAGMSYTDSNKVEHVMTSYQDVMNNQVHFAKSQIDDLNQYMTATTIAFLGRTGELMETDNGLIAEWMNLLFPDANMDLLQRKAVEVGDKLETVMAKTISASVDNKEGIRWNQDIVATFNMITPDGQVLDEDSFNEYISELFGKSADLDELFENDKIENGGKGLLVSADVDFDSFDEAIRRGELLTKVLQFLQQAYYGVAESNKSWLEVEAEQAEQEANLNWAKSNGFAEQIGELQSAMAEGGIEKAMEVWKQYDGDLQKAVGERFPDLVRALRDSERALNDQGKAVGDVTDETKKMNTALDKAAKSNAVKYLNGTNEAIEKLRKGTISATDAYDAFNKELNQITKAQEDIADITEKQKNGTDYTASDISNLANVLGMSTDEVMNDLDGAVDKFNELIGKGGELEEVFYRLNEAAFIRITGTSDVDFSALQEGIITTENMTEQMLDLLEATGQWEVETVDLKGFAWVLENGKWIQKEFNSMQQILKPTRNNPFAGRSYTPKTKSNNDNRSTPRSGNNNDNNNDDRGESEVDKMLKEMEKIQEMYEWQRKYFDAKKNYYSKTGQLQGVIKSLEEEISIIQDENKALKENVKQIEALIKAKQAELEGLDPTSEAYANLSDDLQKLIAKYREWILQIENNNSAIEDNQQAIEDQQKAIRQMEIDIKNEIYQAIQDRENKKKKMLQGEIDMENAVLEALKRRYEKERDEIIQTAELKIEALEQERDLLSEQLELRKKLEQKEDKAKKLAQLELQYQRISADPTRAKEAKKIQDEIAELRKDMAWEAAEEEVQAQQDALDQQIDSLQEYIDYVKSYYDDILNNPKKLIAEMKDIMMMTDDEIIEWLKQNDEEYQNATDNRRKQIEDGWRETFDDMHGIVRTYWDEVEEIYAQGHDAIIQFLKDNRDDYANAGEQQGQAYLEEWQKKLDDLKKAMEDVEPPSIPSYTPPSDGNYNPPSGGNNPPSGGNNNPPQEQQMKHFSMFDHYGFELNHWLDSKSKSEAKRKLMVLKNKHMVPDYYNGPGHELTDAQIAQKAANGGQAFLRGGYVDYTGPAWVDGSPTNPEAVLNPYQTKLFEAMVQAMDQISRISISGMPNYSGTSATGGVTSVGDIIVNVDNLNTDDDYETLAKKVSEVLMERIGRTSVVGGIRINP